MVIIEDEPDIPNAPKTDYEIPDPDMEMVPVDQERSEPNDTDYDDRDQYDQDQENSNEPDYVEGPEGSNQGNTGSQGNSDGNVIPDWADIILSHVFGPLQRYAEKLNIKFDINPDLPVGSEAQYNATTDTITLRNSEVNDHTVRALTHELIHAVQDQLGLTDSQSRANVEYQAYMLVDIMYTINGKPSNGTTGADAADDYLDWLNSLIKDDGSFNKDGFNEHWKEHFNTFMERYKDEIKDQAPNDNYDWKWNEIIDILFTDIKDEVGGVVIIPGGDPGGQ